MSLAARLEKNQAAVYVLAIALGAATGLGLSGTGALQSAVSPAIAVMLFATFLQVPMTELGEAFRDIRFLGALLAANFVVIPLVVLSGFWLLPEDPLIRLGVALVLLSPCIDYVVAFAHLGQADSRRILAATPVLLLVQMLLLGPFLEVMPGVGARGLLDPAPFLHALVWLIGIPLLAAGACQTGRVRRAAGERVMAGLGLLPVPATAAVLFVVVASVMPDVDRAREAALAVVPFYAAFACVAPLAGWGVGRAFRLGDRATRAVAFSAATRNSLVVLPLALAIPGALPVVPAVIVTQTLVELLSELVYIRVLPRLGNPPFPGRAGSP
ncbi:arsenic resistance protein [Phaeovibrio sulfidiphilus]|uniref:Arsenic resistance protein n=1 Tax=Phaeovibrio sulfidiphilus TaxID=1220600 RepID=A0A8J6YWH1_9PROT|nr:arsenic resistance protein [Phaeovibrio sulfidiphilus]MBE1237724.1 arsenic resistance protein [Phaeovibrio sulfidiphilus]